MALVITDLDNTLYDWVSFYAPSFSAMVKELHELIGVDEETLLAEFKVVHQSYGNSEQPFAILELPSVRRTFGDISRGELAHKLHKPLSAFNDARAQYLRLYDSVGETLAELQRRGHIIVGHTEAILVNSYYRMVKLDIAKFFTRLYTLEGRWEKHPEPNRVRKLNPPDDFVRIIPRAERKPNPDLLQDICAREGFDVDESIYIGDSLTRDMTMATAAGVRAVWARYGTRFDREHWKLLVSVTHWTDEDVRREELLREISREVRPDYIIDSFCELVDVMYRAGLVHDLSDPRFATDAD